MPLPCHSNCAYKKYIPGNCHIKCSFEWRKSDKYLDLSGISNHASQWFHFPVNYDPVWGPDECPAKSEKADPEMTRKPDPLEDMMSLML